MTLSLVTGGGGFIGSSIAQRLLERGDEVVVFDNFITGQEDAVPRGTRLIRGDLRNQDDINQACEGVEVVYHQAALRSVPRSVDQPALAHECNVTGTLNLLIAAERSAVRRVVYASSSSAYGDVGDTINVETLPTDPQSPYAASKLAAELYCRVWSKLERISTVSLRYFNVFGPGQNPDSKYSAVFPAFISALMGGKAPEVHSDGEQSRDFTFIDDVVSANLHAAEAVDADGAVINIASGRPKTVNEVLKAVSDELGIWIEPTYVAKRPGDVRATRADISRARELTGWEPKVPWNEAVKATVSSFRK